LVERLGTDARFTPNSSALVTYVLGRVESGIDGNRIPRPPHHFLMSFEGGNQEIAITGLPIINLEADHDGVTLATGALGAAGAVTECLELENFFLGTESPRPLP